MTQVLGMNPRTGETVPPGSPESRPHEVEAVLQAAAAAFPSFSQSRPEVRITLLRNLADRLDLAADVLIPVAVDETGLPHTRLAGEVTRTSNQLRLFADAVAEGGYLEVIVDEEDRCTVPPRPDLRRCLRPSGPVLVFAASNFPFAFSVMGSDTASALAAGAPVIVKCHPSHPNLSRATSAIVSDVIAESGLPTGIFAGISGEEAGVVALRDPRVKACGFTGSTTGGRYLYDIACSRPDPIPFFGELGSINPAVVTTAALRERGESIAKGFVESFTQGAGQFCTKPGLLFLPANDAVLDRISELVEALSAAPMLNERIASQLEHELTAMMASGDLELLARGQETTDDRGFWSTPTLFITTIESFIAHSDTMLAERFGPVAIIVTHDDATSRDSALSRLPGTLTATIQTGAADPESASIISALADVAGRVVINGWPTGVAVTWSMHHGGPWPSTTNSAHTSVGVTAIRRWLRPVCYQGAADDMLPEVLQRVNPWHVPRRINGQLEN